MSSFESLLNLFLFVFLNEKINKEINKFIKIDTDSNVDALLQTGVQ